MLNVESTYDENCAAPDGRGGGEGVGDHAGHVVHVCQPRAIRSEPTPGRPKARRYYREDLERLLERKEARRDPARAMARGLHWGGPVLESGITLIHNGRFYYRGHDAVALAETASLEHAAGLLWAADETERERLFEQPCALSARQLAQRAPAPGSVHSASGRVADGREHRSGVLRSASGRGPADGGSHHSLADNPDRATPCERACTSDAANRLDAEDGHGRRRDSNGIGALCDHELNVSSFVARCAASAGASPYDVVSAAVATLKGHKHGGASERVLALLAEAETPKRARDSVAGRLRRGEALPGFGHPLYAAGDPRATILLRGRVQRKRGGVASRSESREGRIGVAPGPSEPGFRVGGGYADVPIAQQAPVRLVSAGLGQPQQ